VYAMNVVQSAMSSIALVDAPMMPEAATPQPVEGSKCRFCSVTVHRLWS
jgi:hypothetical protein